MTEATSTRRLIRSPRDGRLLSALMLPGVLAWPGSGYGVITTTGRKTGKARRKCIRVIRRGKSVHRLAPPARASDDPPVSRRGVGLEHPIEPERDVANPRRDVRGSRARADRPGRAGRGKSGVLREGQPDGLRRVRPSSARAPDAREDRRAASLLVRYWDTTRSRLGGLASAALKAHPRIAVRSRAQRTVPRDGCRSRSRETECVPMAASRRPAQPGLHGRSQLRVAALASGAGSWPRWSAARAAPAGCRR